MSKYQEIPFNHSSIQGNEIEYIQDAIQKGQIAGDQYYSKKCEDLLENVTGCKRALLTTSCTHALEMCAYLLKLKAGDEVIVPDFTFVSTANAFVSRGAVPRFCDIRQDTLNIDESKIEALITSRTRAIVVVHYAGVACEMDTILAIANKYGLLVIEDNAHGLFGKYKGRWLGTLGALATQSFHETKNISCGEGGALLINDEQYIQEAEIIREKGTNRSQFFRGKINKYSWVGPGSSYVMSDVLAAFLYGQLEQWKTIQEKRRRIWKRYHEALTEWCEEKSIRRPFVPEHYEQAYHMYYLLFPEADKRDEFIAHLKSHSIRAVFHYVPLHQTPYGREFAVKGDECKISVETSSRLVRLPFYNDLNDDDQKTIISEILSFDN